MSGRCCGWEDEAQAGVVENPQHAGAELVLIAGKYRRVVVLPSSAAVVGEHVVQAEVAGVVRHVVHAGVAEVRQARSRSSAGHGDLGDDIPGKAEKVE